MEKRKKLIRLESKMDLGRNEKNGKKLCTPNIAIKEEGKYQKQWQLTLKISVRKK